MLLPARPPTPKSSQGPKEFLYPEAGVRGSLPALASCSSRILTDPRGCKSHGFHPQATLNSRSNSSPVAGQPGGVTHKMQKWLQGAVYTQQTGPQGPPGQHPRPAGEATLDLAEGKGRKQRTLHGAR